MFGCSREDSLCITLRLPLTTLPAVSVFDPHNEKTGLWGYLPRSESAGTVTEKGTSRQRSGKGAIRKRFPLQKPRWEKTKLTIRYLYHETYRKPNEQLFSQ